MNAEFRGRYLGLLMEKVRQDQYPSTTHMQMLEAGLPPEAMPVYIDILLEKVENDPYPSITMLKQIDRLTLAAR